ncbi:MAG: ATP-binding protein [Bdellovibrionia bacterium]
MENRKILIIDDNADIHNDFKKILLLKTKSTSSKFSELGKQLLEDSDSNLPLVQKGIQPEYLIDSAYQGEEGYEMAKSAFAAGKPYALAFVDVRMPPGWDGIKTTEHIFAAVPDTEVVICSAYLDYPWKEFNRRFATADKLVFLRKPFDAMEIQQLALTMTTKWNSARQAKFHFTSLEAIVEERTQLIKEQQTKLIRAEKMAALGTMCAGIAHEINTPLTIISLTLEQLQEIAESEPAVKSSIVKELTEKLKNTTDRIAGIIRGMLTFSSPNSQQNNLKSTDIKQIIKDTLGLCEQRFENSDIKLTYSQIDSSELTCRVVEIVQAILNLLNNAFDAVSELPELDEKWVRIDVCNRNEYVEIAVTDSGKGIPATVRDHIFNPFFTTKDIGSGTGLGLSITKGIIDSHCGSLFVDVNNPNTRFVIRLPLAK